jgi:protein-tyrosine phosphatase
MVHCTAGKDRTGVIVALILGLLGVPEKTIIEDYALSATYLGAPFIAEAQQRAMARGVPWEQYAPLIGSAPEYMQATLQHLHARYGGITAYIRGIGLSETQIAILQTALVV